MALDLICDDFNETEYTTTTQRLWVIDWVNETIQWQGYTHNANGTIFGSVVNISSECAINIERVVDGITFDESNEQPARWGRSKESLAWVERFARIQVDE